MIKMYVTVSIPAPTNSSFIEVELLSIDLELNERRMPSDRDLLPNDTF